MDFPLTPPLSFLLRSPFGRFHQAADVMQGSVHEAYSFFSGGHLRGLSFLMMALAAITVGLMAIQLLASLELTA